MKKCEIIAVLFSRKLILCKRIMCDLFKKQLTILTEKRNYDSTKLEIVVDQMNMHVKYLDRVIPVSIKEIKSLRQNSPEWHSVKTDVLNRLFHKVPTPYVFTGYNPLFNQMGIYQVRCSLQAKFFGHKLRSSYNLKEANLNRCNCGIENYRPTLFFGLYTREDMNKIMEHKGLRYILWSGTDCDIRHNVRIKEYQLCKVKEMPDLIHLASSPDMLARLNGLGIEAQLLELDFTEHDPQYQSRLTTLGKKVYISNGVTKGEEYLFGKVAYEEVMRRLPEFTFVLSNTLNKPQNRMIDVYKECFVALRLTDFEGLGCTLRELNRLGIPIIRNGTVDEIVESIKKYFLCYHK